MIQQMGTKGKGFAVSNCPNHRENSTILCTALQSVLPFPGFWVGSSPGGLGNQCIGTGSVAALSVGTATSRPRFPLCNESGGLGQSCIRTSPVASLSVVTDDKKASPIGETFLFVLALPIFPASHPASIVGADELNFCVRDGNRWTLIAINTNYVGWVLPISFMSKPSLGSNCFAFL